MRLAGAHVLACNPLPGVGVMSGLTHLVARSNYGINRWVVWCGVWCAVVCCAVLCCGVWCAGVCGVGVMSGLTHLVARSNYGINRCVVWLLVGVGLLTNAVSVGVRCIALVPLPLTYSTRN
jgi:hypothetical protein